MHSNNINSGGQLGNLQSIISDALNGGKQNSPFASCPKSQSGMFQVNPFNNQSVLAPFMNHGNSNPMEMIINMLINVFTSAMQNSFGTQPMMGQGQAMGGHGPGSAGFGSPMGGQGFGSPMGGQGFGSPAFGSPLGNQGFGNQGFAQNNSSSMFGQNGGFNNNSLSGFGAQQGGFNHSAGLQTNGNFTGPANGPANNGPANYSTGAGQGGGYGSAYGGGQTGAAQQQQGYTPESNGAAGQGIQSSGSGCPFLAQSGGQDAGSGSGAVQDTGGADNRDVDFKNLTAEQRSDLGLNNTDRAVLHLWGRQMISAGKQDGGIYSTVLGADGTGSGWENKTEVALVQDLRAREQEMFGGDTGHLLDQAFFDLHGQRTGEDLSSRYAGRAVNFSQGAINITNDIGTIQNRTGLDQFEQGVLRLYGHDPLMDGQWDGSVLAYTVGNDNSLDGATHSEGNTIDNVAQSLFDADINDDGVNNGSSLNNAFVSVLDSLYLA